MNTLEYYNKYAKEYFETTVNTNLNELYSKFLPYLSNGAKILDAGCGSGRDSKFFLAEGFTVTAMDASKEMAALAYEYICQDVLVLKFEDIKFKNEFDAIWACASLLHVKKEDLDFVFGKLFNALKPNGIIFMCFKYGNDETKKDGRFFNNYNEETFSNIISKYSNIKVNHLWASQDSKKSSQKWLNVILSLTP